MTAEKPSSTPWGLVISLAINGLLIGLLAGVMLSGGPGYRGGPPGGPPGSEMVGAGGVDRGLGRAILQAAPSEDRLRIRRIMRDAWPATEADRKLIREAQQAIAKGIAADPFNGDDIAASFETWRSADMRIKAAVQGAMIQALESLPPESRQTLAEEMKRHRTRRQERRERLRDREPGPPRGD